MKRIPICAFAAGLALLAIPISYGELIIKKDGEIVEGRILARDSKGLTVQLDSAKTVIPLQLSSNQVARIIEIDDKGAVTAEANGTEKPAKRPESAWDVPKEPAAPLIAVAGKDPTYYVIPLHGAVGQTILADALEKSLADAAKRKPTVVVLDIDSPGGLIHEADLMMKTLHQYNKDLRIVALADQTLSAAAITALSVRSIYMKSTGTIGAATAFDGSNPNMPKDISEKMQSAWRAAARNSAEEGGHDPQIAEAMIDSSQDYRIEIEDGRKVIKEGQGPNMLVNKGKILTLTSHEAVNCGLAAGIADDFGELGEELGMKGWKEMPGLGKALADYIPSRWDAFTRKLDELEAVQKANVAEAKKSAPSEEVITQSIVTGSPNPFGPIQVGPRGRPGGAGIGGPVVQRVVTQQVTTISPQVRAQWNARSLATVVAIEKMEQTAQDEISLAEAYGNKGVAESIREALPQLADARALIYAGRNKFENNSSSPSISPSITSATRPISSSPPAERPFSLEGTALAPPALTAKNAPLAAKFAAAVQKSITQRSSKSGEVIGGGNAKDAFDDISMDGGVLIGLRCGMGKVGDADVIESVEPVFLTSKGVVEGRLHGNPTASPVIDIIARDGYGVGGAKFGGKANLDSVSLIFMRLNDGLLDATDFYISPRIGNTDQATATITTTPVVGITGKSNDAESMGLGLVFMNDPILLSSLAPQFSARNAPLPTKFADVVKESVEGRSYKLGQIYGGGKDAFGRPADAFEEMNPDGGILIGLRCGMGNVKGADVVESIQPVFLTAKGATAGKLHGDPTASPVIDLIARDGYAVGGAKIGGKGNIDSLSLIYMRLADGKLDPKDAFQTDLIGSSDQNTTVLATQPVIGINGGTNDGGNIGLGLIIMKDPELAKAALQALTGKNAPLAPEFSDILKTAISNKSYKASQTVGGAFAEDPFEDMAPDGGLMIGMRCGMRKTGAREIVVSIQPIYLTSRGAILGKLQGATEAERIVDLVARDGYAVAGAKLSGGINLEGLALIFARIGNGRLNASDTYTTDRLGYNDRVTTLGGSVPILGIKGKSKSDGGLALGLILLDSSDPNTPDAPQAP